MNVHIACGGTGGHVFPGLAAAGALRRRGHEVTVWVAGRVSEAGPLSAWDGRILSAGGSGFSGRASAGWILSGLRMMAACFRAYGQLRAVPCDVLLAMGSYACVPPAVAALMLRIPVVLHEANAVPGRAVAALARLGCTVALSFPRAGEALKGRRVCFTGFPLRTDLDEAPEMGELSNDRFTLLVMGGSQGAGILNEIAPEAVIDAAGKGLALQVIHLAGKGNAASVKRRYEDAGVPCIALDFLSEMGRAYNSADLAVCRSGGATCAELAACRVPSLLVPLPKAPGDHQAVNAAALTAAGGADMVRQEDLSVEYLSSYILNSAGNERKLSAMRTALSDFSKPGAADRLAELLEEIA